MLLKLSLNRFTIPFFKVSCPIAIDTIAKNGIAIYLLSVMLVNDNTSNAETKITENIRNFNLLSFIFKNL